MSLMGLQKNLMYIIINLSLALKKVWLDPAGKTMEGLAHGPRHYNSNMAIYSQMYNVILNCTYSYFP